MVQFWLLGKIRLNVVEQSLQKHFRKKEITVLPWPCNSADKKLTEKAWDFSENKFIQEQIAK